MEQIVMKTEEGIVVKGGEYPIGNVQKASMKNMVEAGWLLASTALWNGKEIPEREMKYARNRIKDIILNRSEDHYKGWLEFCQRVLLTREYYDIRRGRCAQSPGRWFQPNNDKGYTGTRAFYFILLFDRVGDPLHRHELKALPEAVLDMIENPTGENFHYWRTWFIVRRKNGIANLFLAVVGNMGIG